MEDFERFRIYVGNDGELHIVPNGSDTVYFVREFVNDFTNYLRKINYKIKYDDDGYINIPIEIYEEYFDAVCENTDTTYNIDEFMQFEVDDNGYIIDYLLHEFSMLKCLSYGYKNINLYIDEHADL